MRDLRLISDKFGALAIGLMPTNHVDNIVLVANTPQLYTIPNGATHVLIVGSGLFYSKFGGAAAIPVANVLDGTGSSISPELRDVPDGCTTIGFVAPANCILSIDVFGG